MRAFLSLSCAVACFLGSAAIASQDLFTGGGPILSRDHIHDPYDNRELNIAIGQAIVDLGLETQASEAAASFSRDTSVPLSFPLRPSSSSEDAQVQATVNFVDLNSSGGVLDANCGARTYNGHQGIDYLVAPFWWDAMDENRVEVVAAAAGTILFKIDGNFDRQCRRNGHQDNLVVVLHDDGLAAVYRHLESGSLTAANVGDRVEEGDFIGLVGSSGSSTAPHLHFELQIYDETRPGDGVVIDPNLGPCGASSTLWRHQPQYFDPDILSIRTHVLPPVISSFGSACVPDQPNLADRFQPGQTAYWAVYLRNQRPGETVDLTVFRPDGSEFSRWTLGATLFSFQPFSYWYAGANLPPNAPTGHWRVRAEFADRIIERAFIVGDESPGAETRVRAAVLPASRSVRAGSMATAFATVLNAGSDRAFGCSIQTAEPFAGTFSFAETEPASNAVTGLENQLFDLAPGGSRSFVISAQPEAGASARSMDLSLRYDCENGNAAPTIIGLNTLRLSFDDSLQPDMIAIAVTSEQNGVLTLNGPSRPGAFAVAAANVGVEGHLIVRPRTSHELQPELTLSICETNPATGACLAARSGQVERAFGAGETSSFAVFVTAESGISFDPAQHRVFLDIVDSSDVSRGSTSVAIRTR